MSDIKWTKEQLEAITESGCNIIVAAAAGAGKTAVLVERIIEKITSEENPVDIDKLLVVTFTNAAATEMRERIGDAIIKRLEKNPTSRKLQRQLILLNKANITTIHSFCLDVIRNNFHFIDIDPDFRIADSTESMLMKLEALDEVFEAKYAEDNVSEEFLRLVECYGRGRDDGMLKDMVLELYEFVMSSPWPDKWLHKNCEAFNIPEGSDFTSTVWAKMLLEITRTELSGFLDALDKALAIASGDIELSPYAQTLHEDYSTMSDILEMTGSIIDSISDENSNEKLSTPGSNLWDKLYDAFETKEFRRLLRCGKDADKEKQERVKSLRNEAKEGFRKLADEIFTSGSSTIVRDLRSLYPLVKCLAQLVMEFGSLYAKKKRGKSVLDFNDLEHFCLGILTESDGEGSVSPSKTALMYRERFSEVLVDEYQDSNMVQEVILSLISRRDDHVPNMFMVGDVKQCIYRFRLARPELFLEKYNTYDSESGSRNRKIKLYKNFRSRSEILSGVNYIFRQIMSETAGELNYDESEELNPGAVFDVPGDCNFTVGGPVELHIIDMDDSNIAPAERNDDETSPEAADFPGNDYPEEDEPDAIQCEARLAAKRIKELVNSNNGEEFRIYDKRLKKYRKVEFKDIVILLRTTRNWSDIFIEELGKEGLPVYADTGTGYFKTVEVETVMSLLQIIDNPLQDIPLLSVLRSPIGGFVPDELTDIRMADRNGSFYEAMKKIAGEGTGKTAEKAGRFLNSLAAWRDAALYMSTDELVWHLYNDTGYYSYVGAMPGGIQRQANLRMLFERARRYEETSYKGLFNFIHFINRLKSSGEDMGSAKILGEDENVIRVMSIHKSKGLEFPIVIVAGCGKRFNLKDLNSSILLHQDMGFGPDYVDPERRISYPTAPKQALKYKIRLETLSEEMRILYVAFTRAKEKLIITGTVKNIPKTLAKWYNCINHHEYKLPVFRILKGMCFLDWIGPAIIRHKDSKALLEAYGIGGSIPVLEDEKCSRWDIRTWEMKDMIIRSEAGDELEEEDLDGFKESTGGTVKGEFYDEVDRRLSWEYPYSTLVKLPTKISVTELKRLFAAESQDEYPPSHVYFEPIVKKPAFLEEAHGLSQAEKGTILHFVMQHIDLSKVSGINDIKKQVEKMVLNELLTQKQAETVDLYRIHRFFSSPLGGRMLKASKVYREVSFNIELGSSEVTGIAPWFGGGGLRDDISKDLEETAAASGFEKGIYEDGILLQGIIDCYFEEDNELVLIDYKTDYIPEGGIETIKERYRLQINYYAGALERLTQRKVKERFVYLFRNGEIIEY